MHLLRENWGYYFFLSVGKYKKFHFEKCLTEGAKRGFITFDYGWHKTKEISLPSGE